MKHKSIRYFLKFSFLFCFCGFSACNKEKITTVNGVLLDKHTGMPVQKALVEFKILDNNDPNPYPGGLIDVTTDDNGRFSYQGPVDYSVEVYWIVKDGYLPKGLGTHVTDIKQGENNDVTIEIIPKDGVIKLNYENMNSTVDTLYLAIYSNLQDKELSLSNGIILGSSYFVHGATPSSLILNLASEETIDIYWGFVHIDDDNLQAAPNHDSVNILRNDTTYFTLKY